MKMKKIVAMTSAIVIALSLAACSSSTTSNTDVSPTAPSTTTDKNEASTDKNEAFTLRIVCTGQKDDGIDVATKLYKEIYPNATIETITSTWGDGGADMRNKELLLISSGQEPDLGKMVWGKELFKEGVLTDITEEVKQFPGYSNLTQGQLERMTLDGKHFGITTSNNCIMLFYNKDLLAKVGVTEPPKTIEELDAICQKVKDANLKNDNGDQVYSMNFEGGNWATDYWLWSLGGKQMTDDFKTCLIDSSESVAAYKKMQDYINKGYAPKPDGSYDKLWLNNQLVFFPCGTWEVPATNDAKINAGYTVMPTGANGNDTCSIGGVEWGLFKSSKHKQQALDFMKIYWSDEFQKEFPRGITNQNLYNDPQEQANWEAQGPGFLEAYLAQGKQLLDTKYNFLEAPFIFPDASKIYADALDKVLVGLEDPQTVMTDAAKQINDGIAAAN